MDGEEQDYAVEFSLLKFQYSSLSQCSCSNLDICSLPMKKVQVFYINPSSLQGLRMTIKKDSAWRNTNIKDIKVLFSLFSKAFAIHTISNKALMPLRATPCLFHGNIWRWGSSIVLIHRVKSSSYGEGYSTHNDMSLSDSIILSVNGSVVSNEWKSLWALRGQSFLCLSQSKHHFTHFLMEWEKIGLLRALVDPPINMEFWMLGFGEVTKIGIVLCTEDAEVSANVNYGKLQLPASCLQPLLCQCH